MDFNKIEKYAHLYKKIINNEIDKSKLTTYDLPEEIISSINYFTELDSQYQFNSDREKSESLRYYMKTNRFLHKWQAINNRQWIGYWQKASGSDVNKLIAYLKEAVTDNRNIIEKFKKEYATNDVPYCISIAEGLRKKFLA